MNISIRDLMILSFVAISLASCSEEQRGGDRLPTFPVIGRVTVDGQPAEYLGVSCINPELPETLRVSAYTDKEGNFKVGTYESGDGAPVGTYKMAFKWGNLSLMTGRYEGDKLSGLYADPEKSEFTFTVKEGEPNDLGEIKLSTANATEVEKRDFDLKTNSNR